MVRVLADGLGTYSLSGNRRSSQIGLNKSRHRITESSVDSMAASLPAQEQDCTLVKRRQLARCEYRVQPAYAPVVVYFNMDRISGCLGSG